MISLGVMPEWLPIFELANKPIVGIEAPHHFHAPWLYVVRTDSVQGMYQAARHVIEAGHRNIYYLSFREGFGRESQVSLERFSGVAMALREAGLPMGENRILTDFVHADAEEPAATARGHRAMMELLSRDVQFPLACICFSDLDAEGAARAAKEKGLRIPQDVSLVGYDDIPAAAAMSPPLTTISVPRVELGRQAIRTILQVPQGNANHETILNNELVVRQSVLKL